MNLNYNLILFLQLDLERSDPTWYATLTSFLNEDQRKSVQEIFTLADQRKAAAESKEILKRGGKSIWIERLLIFIRALY